MRHINAEINVVIFRFNFFPLHAMILLGMVGNMEWFGGSYKENPFIMFSANHLIMLAFLLIISAWIFLFRTKLRAKDWRSSEIGLAILLTLFEVTYYVWLIRNRIWHVSDSLPLELCSISLLLTIILLLTKKKWVYEILLFTGLLGATQALVTPLLYYDFPHFRFLHFFFTHFMMIWVPLYFTWVKGYRPTIWSVVKLLLFLNVLLPIIMAVNKLVNGNYMFLRHKPESASLLDYLGPYPNYIFSMEGLLIALSLLIWLLFRKKAGNKPIRPKGLPR